MQLPPFKTFSSAEAYYSVAFHELTHSTGHKDRLNREGVTTCAPFGSAVYSREELVAELGAAMINSVVGIETPDLLTNSAAYIAGWRKALTDDPKGCDLGSRSGTGSR